MYRRLAVPVAVRNMEYHRASGVGQFRRVREDGLDRLDVHIMRQISENRQRIEEIRQGLESWEGSFDGSDIQNELDYVRANIQLSMIGIAGELEDVPSSDEIIGEVLAY